MDSESKNLDDHPTLAGQSSSTARKAFFESMISPKSESSISQAAADSHVVSRETSTRGNTVRGRSNSATRRTTTKLTDASRPTISFSAYKSKFLPKSPRPATSTFSTFKERLKAAQVKYDISIKLNQQTAPAEPIPATPGDDSPGELKKIVADGLHAIDMYRLCEAEMLFQRALCSMEEKMFPGSELLFVQSLSGLAFVFFKRSRSHRHDDMEWHRLMLQSCALQDELVRFCVNLEDRFDTMTDRERKKLSWLSEEKKKAEHQLRVVDQLLVEALQVRVALEEIRKPTGQISQASSFLNIAWLTKFVEHIQYKMERMYEDGLTSPRILPPEEALESVSTPSVVTPEDQPNIIGSRVRKLDFDRVQRTIMKLVRQISSDMRQRYIRKKLSEKVFRESVSNEMIAKCATMAETKDVLELFENALIQYNYGVSAEEFRQWNVEPIDVDSDGTGCETTSTDTSSEENTPANLPYMPSMYDDEFLPDSTLEPYNFPGVVTLWRKYDKKHKAHVRTHATPFKPYLLQGFEEYSPLTETALLSSEHTRPSQVVDSSGSSSVASSSPSMPSPTLTRPPNYITDHRMQYALAISLSKCAKHLQCDPQALNQSCELYKYALGVLHKIPKDFPERQNTIAGILKNVGVIRCAQGEVTMGSQLMLEAMELYSPNNDVENIHVAEVWFELGQAYMQQQSKEDSIFEHVMRLVRDELCQDLWPEDDFDDNDSIDSDCSDGGATYSVCAQEAMGCYKSSLAILSRLRLKKEIHTSLYVDVLTKLGDCTIIVGEYERAVLCYEEALYLCQNTLGSVSLSNSAHILSMLGTTNFLLRTYSKAATMYETATILQQHLYGYSDNFEMAFTMSMLGTTYNVMQHYHKCVAWCIKAFEIYVNIYKHEIIFVDALHRWFISHTLFCLGYAYGLLNFHDKALHNLSLAKNMIEKAPEGDIDVQQHVRILKVLADVNANAERNDLAIEYYQEALNQSMKLGNDTSVTTLQNQLLNRMAGIHVNTKQYDTAAEYLEQALDCQRNVETSIKGDLIGIMFQLGNTYTLSGDIDRALECFQECFEAYQESHISSGPDLAKTLCHLGTLYHLKGCMQDDNDDMMEYLDSADQYYKDAVQMDPLSPICVYYANFLLQQEQYADALEVILDFIFKKSTPDVQEMRYNGPEQAILPEHLLYDLNDIDEVVLDTKIFAKFLGILCLKQLGLYDDAMDCLVSMVTSVDQSAVSLNHSMLGYALIEMALYQEAAASFSKAAVLQHDSLISLTNQWIALFMSTLATISKAFFHIWVMTTEAYVDVSEPAVTPTVLPAPRTLLYQPLRDSGYYDHAEIANYDFQPLVTSKSRDYGYRSVDDMPDILSPISPDVANENVFQEDSSDEWHHYEETVETPQYILEAIFKSQTSVGDALSSRSQYTEHTEPSDGWIVEEEVTLDTPSVILAALSGKLTIDQPRQQTDQEIYDYELKHKTAQTRHEKRTTSSDWSGQSRSSAPPDLLEGLHCNYSNNELNKNEMKSHADSNGNGLFASSRRSETNWRTHYDSFNSNSSKSVTSPELNANITDDGQDEVWQTIEETVETPLVLLQALMSKNKV